MENKEENKKEIKSVEELFPKEKRTNEIENEKDEIKEWEGIIKRKDLKNEPNKYRLDFEKLKQ